MSYSVGWRPGEKFGCPSIGYSGNLFEVRDDCMVTWMLWRNVVPNSGCDFNPGGESHSTRLRSLMVC